MSPLPMSLIAFAFIFGGTFVGMSVRHRLPEHHLRGDTKDVVRLGTGLIGTIAALVLGLLIASANSNYEGQSNQVKQLVVGAVLLDRTLTLYGPETDPIRGLLRQGIISMADQIWRENSADSARATPFAGITQAEPVYDAILKLSPRDEIQRSLQTKALDAAVDLTKARLALFAKAGGPIPMPFLVVLISWLTIIFASYSLFAAVNATTITALGIFALSASASLFLILELSQPFSGLMMISSEPLRSALAPLGS